MGVTGSDLMKYSFLDLVYKGVLKVYKDWRLPHPRDARERHYTFVAKGERFKAYVKTDHQDPFVAPFLAEDCEYQLRFLVKRVLNTIGKAPKFKSNKVYKELKDNGYFTSFFWLKYLNLFLLNSKGSQLKKDFKSILKEADDTLPKFVETNPEKTKQMLAALGSNILLLNCFNDEFIAQLKKLFGELDKAIEHIPGIAIGMGEQVFEVLFYTFLDSIDYFDNSFETFDASFDFGGGDFGGDLGGGDWGGIDI